MRTESHVYPVLGRAPATASAREYLRRGLPEIYREPAAGGTADDAFVMRFLSALEEVLDPVVTMVDLLPSHLDLAVAPPEILALVAAWLGVELDDAVPHKADRHIVAAASQPKQPPRRADSRRHVEPPSFAESHGLAKTRGTRACVERTLSLSFDKLRLDVREGGRATWSQARAPVPAGEPTLTVSAPHRLDPRRRDAIRRLVGAITPAHVRFTLEEGGSA